jgi:hypothetical protein
MQPADESNPRGFYEPQWVVDFHKRLLHTVPARTNDARPRAAADIREVAAAPALREELHSWLAEQVGIVGRGGQIVVKDPRAFWVHELWSGVADDLDIDLSYLTMLRHPAEVVQSRETHYLTNQTDEFRRTRQTANLAGWVNSAFETEVATRARPRTFVRYEDLLADWRAAMSHVQDQLPIRFEADLASEEHHEVDDFIDVTLRRARITWDDVDTIPELRDQAALAWDACNVLVDSPYDAQAVETLAQVHERYVMLHGYAEAIALDHTNVSVVQERRSVQQRQKKKQRELARRLRDSQEQAEGLQQRLAASRKRARLPQLPWHRPGRKGASAAAPRKTFLLGVGAQKAGTTWLHHHLARSPECARGYRKEYHVFDSVDLPSEPWLKRNVDMAQAELDRLRDGEPADPVHLHRASMIADPDFYFDYFTGLLRSGRRIRLTADVTPEYAMLPVERLAQIRDGFAARRVRTVALFLMRDPVDRIWSQIRMQEGRTPGRFPEPADRMVASLYAEPLYEQWTRYEHTLERLDQVFDPQNLHCGFYEELFEERQVQEICRVLGIRFRQPDFERKANVSSAKAVDALPDEVVEAVAVHFRETYETVAQRFPDKDLRRLWPSSRFVL